MNDTIRKMTADQAEQSRGCWIEGSRGWTGSGYLVEIAQGHGMPLDADDDAIVTAYLTSTASITLTTGETLDADGITGAVIDQGELTDRAQQWLNENIAPEGWAFGWCDGEFFLWPVATSDNVSATLYAYSDEAWAEAEDFRRVGCPFDYPDRLLELGPRGGVKVTRT
jgi:hypothetical protein